MDGWFSWQFWVSHQVAPGCWLGLWSSQGLAGGVNMLSSSLLRLFQTSVHTRVWIPGIGGHWGALLFLVQLMMIPPLTCSLTWDLVVIPASCSLTSPASHSSTEPSRFCLFHISHILPHAPCCSGRTEGKSFDLSWFDFFLLFPSYLFLTWTLCFIHIELSSLSYCCLSVHSLCLMTSFLWSLSWPQVEQITSFVPSL